MCMSTPASHLDQVLFTIGLVFMSVAAVDYVMGSQQQFVAIPSYLQGQINVLGVGVGRYRLLIIAICGVLTLILQLILSRTRFGSRLRAAVDDPRVARGLGINVTGVFAITFAVGSGLAGLGGALGAEILGLDPIFPLKYMIYFLIVVTVGGTSSITGPFLASLLLGIGDVAGKYYMPRLGAFVIYTIMIVVLIWRPHGLFSRGARPMSDPAMTSLHDVAGQMAARARWRLLEIAFWAAALASVFLLPGRHLILTEIVILGAVRALARLDPGLRRHHLARPCRLFRLRGLLRGPARQARAHHRAGLGAGRFRQSRRPPLDLPRASWCCAAPT